MQDARLTRPNLAARRLPTWALCVASALACATGCGREPVAPPVPASVAIVSGDDQTGTVGRPLADPLVVGAYDQAGAGVARVPVTWRVVAGGGRLSAQATTTDGNGRASVTWTLGTAAGPGSVEADVEGRTLITWSATATPGAAAALAFSVPPHDAAAGAPIRPAIQVTVRDSFGNTVTTATTSVTIAMHTAPASAALSGTATVTASGGVASFADLAIDVPGRGYALAASAAGLPSITSPPFSVADPRNLDLSIGGMYVTQATQNWAGTVPLVAGRDAVLRVFVRANQANAARPAVRARLYLNGALVETDTIAAASPAVTTTVAEADLTASWNLRLPGTLVQPGLSVLADVDPSDVVPETDESNNAFPASGVPAALAVRRTVRLAVTFVPVLQWPSRLLGDVTAANQDDYFDFASRVYPLDGYDAVIHEPYTFYGALDSDTAWNQLLGEIALVRVAEGAAGLYYGVGRYVSPSPVAGMGIEGGAVAAGVDDAVTRPGESASRRAQVAAHEWGHNFSLNHVACAGNVEQWAYPYAGGFIGAYGLDLKTSEVRAPSIYYDLMSYCHPVWISDYTYARVFTRALAGAAAYAARAAAAPAQRVLLVWGRMGAAGMVLEPAFEVTAPPSRPSPAGPYHIQVLDPAARLLVDFPFAAEAVDHAEGERLFAMAVPLPASGVVADVRLYAGGARVARRTPASAAMAAPAGTELEARAAERGVLLEWDPARHPAALIRDAETGQVLAIGRGGAIEVRPPSGARALDIILSDGVSSVLRRVAVRAP